MIETFSSPQLLLKLLLPLAFVFWSTKASFSGSFLPCCEKIDRDRERERERGKEGEKRKNRKRTQHRQLLSIIARPNLSKRKTINIICTHLTSCLGKLIDAKKDSGQIITMNFAIIENNFMLFFFVVPSRNRARKPIVCGSPVYRDLRFGITFVPQQAVGEITMAQTFQTILPAVCMVYTNIKAQTIAA